TQLSVIARCRPTEGRFREYGFYELLSQDDKMLDLGCNNGFMLIYAAYLFGCQTVGVDHNEYTINIGKKCAEYLEVSKLVSLQSKTIQDFVHSKEERDFTKVISFATHHTNDGGYRVEISDHLKLVHQLLKKSGLFFFETHMTHSSEENQSFIIEECGGLFKVIRNIYFQDTNRRFFLLKKI
ncbi:MAG TPA: hypothetical protein DD412_00875, partial [Holosporales bacterium]|nr:hypothetical protein [Holosporales bacterium]